MLRLPATARTGEYLAGLCCAVLLAIASEWKGEQVGSISGFYFVMLLFLFFLTPILLETHFVQIDISNGQIHARSPWRKSRSIPFNNGIESIRTIWGPCECLLICRVLKRCCGSCRAKYQDLRYSFWMPMATGCIHTTARSKAQTT